jgi:hypothetical protein
MRLQNEFHQYLLKKGTILVPLGLVYSVPSPFFNIVNNGEEVHPYHLHISLFNELPTSCRCIISSFILMSKHFYFITISRVLKMLQLAPTKTQQMFDVIKP